MISLWLPLTSALVLFFLRAWFVSTETILRSVSSGMVEQLEDSARDERGREAFRRIRGSPENALAASRFCTACCTFLGAPLGIYAFGTLFRPLVVRVFHETGALTVPELAVLIFASVLAAFAAAVVPEFILRTAALMTPARTALRRARAAEFITRLLTPVLRLSARAGMALLRPLGIRPPASPPHPPLEELERLLAEAAKGPGLSRQAPRLIHNIFEMNDRIARDIIVPRTQVISLDVSAQPLDMVKLLAEHGHSRIPVYRGDIDNIVGILHARDLIPMLQCPELIVIEDVIRPALFVPWSKPLGDLLRVMQKKRIHMAIVVDEYGGFLGVVTLEDLLETIVGEIRNEYTEDGPAEIEPLGDGTFIIRGDAQVSAVEQKLGVRFASEEPCETMSGLMSYLSGCIPEAGEKLFVGGCLLTVEERTARRVSLIRCQRVSVPPSTSGADAQTKTGEPA